jgi:2-furoyl-CoA dehydrogenase 2Fe-2S iron sulfur subunit
VQTPNAPPQAVAGAPVLRTRDHSHTVRLRLDGVLREANATPRTLLSDFLRHTLGATACHVGCEHGVCGACTVQVDGVAQRACLTLALQVDGCAVRTSAALAAGADTPLNDLQQAFRQHFALQCGFCTPGILMACDDWLQRPAQQGRMPSEAEVRELLSGHLCRCTGYTPIVAAVLQVAQARLAARPTANAEVPHA